MVARNDEVRQGCGVSECAVCDMAAECAEVKAAAKGVEIAGMGTEKAIVNGVIEQLVRTCQGESDKDKTVFVECALAAAYEMGVKGGFMTVAAMVKQMGGWEAAVKEFRMVADIAEMLEKGGMKVKGVQIDGKGGDGDSKEVKG